MTLDEFALEMSKIKRKIALLNDTYKKLVNWARARVAYKIKKGMAELPDPEVEEVRLLAEIDQRKAEIREDVCTLLEKTQDGEKKQKLVELRSAVERLAMEIRLDGKNNDEVSRD